ncbi:MAG: DUF4870 domain-containing protein [Dehalococcoidales bacterium]|nr:DUF4870 domain-containing protein [Dehalococcoidales bacterium]
MGEARSKTSTGLKPNVAGLLCYVGWWISGLVFLLLEKDNKFVRFHAMQSIVTFGVLNLSFSLILIPIIGWIISYLISVLAFVLWIILMIKAYQGQKYKLPWAGNFAEKQAG